MLDSRTRFLSAPKEGLLRGRSGPQAQFGVAGIPFKEHVKEIEPIIGPKLYWSILWIARIEDFICI